MCIIIIVFFFFFFQAEELIVSQKLDKEYLPISGSAEFCKHAITLALGSDSPVVADGLVGFQRGLLFIGLMSDG